MGKKVSFKTTAELEVPKNLLDQVIGQEEAVHMMRKAAKQRRHVLLIGEPGTGKSLLGTGLAELLPKSELKDVVAFPNPNDENTPYIRELPAGEGRKLVAGAKMKMQGFFTPKNIFFMILVIIAMMAPWYALEKYQSDVIFAAFFIGGMIFLAAFVMFINIGRRMGGDGVQAPKVIVDNANKKMAPFFDATGAHAGALLGDCLHDPLQSFSSILNINKLVGNKIKSVELNQELDPLFETYQNNIIQSKEKKNHEAIFIDQNKLSILGETNGSISPVDVLSCNRYDHDGSMIKFTTSENNELIVTQEHKIAVWKNDKIEYIHAKDIKEGQEVVAQAEDIIIDEQDIINTYDERQQELAKVYYDYLELRQQNSSWGYKRIATRLGVSYGRTRWWWDNNSAPVPIQTCNWLKERGLLPLRIDNSKLPLIAKVLGALPGDGGIFENLNAIFLSSSEKDAVKEFGRDIEEIGNLDMDQNSRIIEGGEYGHSWCYQNTNRNIIRLFLALGAPKGNKTKIKLCVPSWVKLKSNFEKEYWGSFLGGEMSSPTIHKNGNRLTSLDVGITGTEKLSADRINFLSELRDYLETNRVSTTSISEGSYKHKNDSKLFRLLISKKMDNVLLFMMNIKINYCKYKVERLYKALGEWAILKKNKYYELTEERGFGAESAMKTLNLTPNSLYLLLNHFGEKAET
jgi:ATP-dependent Lon protease